MNFSMEALSKKSCVYELAGVIDLSRCTGWDAACLKDSVQEAKKITIKKRIPFLMANN